jgi:hypothetical protein
MMNRVWLHHFGKPLVATPDDFGSRSVPPVIPELLDELALRFMNQGWSLKAMHRMILGSEAWQRASVDRDGLSAANEERDAENDWFWRFESRRLSAEELRDSLLMAGGSLDLEPGGRHPFPEQIHFAFSQHRPFYAVYPSQKRGIYLMQTRLDKHPFLRTFDGAEPTAATGLRSLSVSPMQALYHLNDELVAEQAEGFARRVLKRTSLTEEQRIHHAWLLVYARAPQAGELEAAAAFLRDTESVWREEDRAGDSARLAWTSLARVLLASNEFSFVQ